MGYETFLTLAVPSTTSSEVIGAIRLALEEYIDLNDHSKGNTYFADSATECYVGEVTRQFPKVTFYFAASGDTEEDNRVCFFRNGHQTFKGNIPIPEYILHPKKKKDCIEEDCDNENPCEDCHDYEKINEQRSSILKSYLSFFDVTFV